jgi:prepilin-type N-terminal cleavage/methylation domain-containing protein
VSWRCTAAAGSSRGSVTAGARRPEYGLKVRFQLKGDGFEMYRTAKEAARGRIVMNPEDKPQKKRRDSGFTLVEILTVALIIAVIASFAFPSYRKSRQRALETQGIHGMRAFAAAMEEYYNHNGYYAANFNALKSSGYIDRNYAQSDHYRGLHGSLRPFIKGFTVFWERWPSGNRYSIRARTLYNFNILANDFIELRVTESGNVEIKRYAEGNFWRPT